MSSSLWRSFLENDAERFHRLLEGSQPHTHTSANRSAARSGLTSGSPGSWKATSAFNTSKGRHGTTLDNVVLTKAMLRERDAMGRSILHLACTDPEKLTFLTALLSHPFIDPAAPDAESGWSALHRALYHGNVSAAREILSINPSNWNLVKLKDHAGDTPFEVFGASINGIEELLLTQGTVDSEEMSDDEDETLIRSATDVQGGDEVFTWGTNKNLTLGFSDGDDRAYPERAPFQRPRQLLLEQYASRYARHPDVHGKDSVGSLDATVLFNPLHIVDVQLSRFHSAVLTSDAHSNLFICGFGRGGRLGFGDEQNTQFNFRPLSPPLLPKKKVERVALGVDHTVVVLAGGEVWTWGGNQWGQLGYTLQQKASKEEPFQSTPCQVIGLLKKEVVIGCAASRTHTAVFTSDSLFTFGKNDGQLGILDSSDARTLASQSAPRKVAANFLNGVKISDVVALDKATAILLENHEVWILAGYGYSKLSLSMEVVGLPAGATNITRYDTRPNFVRKITGGGDTLCALSRTGDVFTVDVAATLKERSERGSRKVGWTTQRAWSLRKRHMAVKDVAVGADGNILICTESGSVWKRVKRAKAKEGAGDSGKYKFDRVPGLTRIVAVRSNTTGTFAAIRRDCDIMKTGITVEQQGLWEDVSSLLSIGEMFVDDDVESQTAQIMADEDDDWGYGPKPRPSGYSKAVQCFMSPGAAGKVQSFLEQLESIHGFDEWDMLLSTSKDEKFTVPVHQVIFARSPVLRKQFDLGSGRINNVGEFVSADSGNKAKLNLDNLDVLTILNLTYYMYIDTIIDLWHQRGLDRNQAIRFRELRTELARLATALELQSLAESVGRMRYPEHTMDQDFRAAFKDPNFYGITNMIIDLDDDEELHVHSALMRVRCPFFSALYEGGAQGRWLLGRRDEEKVHVDMKHVSKDIMRMVVSWLYYDWGVEGFDRITVGVKEENLDEYLDFVLDIMSCANELMLGRLSQVCQKILGRYINTKNAAGLLMAVAACSEKVFKDSCLQYICLNIETMLENHLLDELDEDLMAELDETVRANQRQCFPNSRTGRQEAALLEKYPHMKEASEKERAALIASYTEEEASILSSSHRAQSFIAGSASPSSSVLPTPGAKARRKSSKGILVKGAPSPSMKPVPGNDEIFSMDEEESLSSPGESASPSATSAVPRRKDGTQKPSMPTSLPSPQLSPEDPFIASMSTVTQPQVPWQKVTPVKAEKLALKDIIEQASAVATGKSALTAGLNGSPLPKPKPAESPAKLSQKERKRQQQQQQPLPQRVQSYTTTPEKKPGTPWNLSVAAQTPRVSLKDVLSSEPSAPSALSPQASTPQRRPNPTPLTPVTPVSSTPTRRTVSATVHPSPTPARASPAPRPTPSPASPAPQPRRAVSNVLPEATLQLSLKDIISQEEAQKEIVADYSAKRSLEDIQAEQEFMRWWESESQKVQQEASGTGQRRERRGRGGGGSGGRGGRGGGAGRGRGRRRRGDSQQQQRGQQHHQQQQVGVAGK